ncbi:sigma-70 family RNA polymerase sigma factor [Thiohalorhabdus methylotrophus]|uniref:Sigma-70 family RNA polymerase sigma factor n=1 Tax=Thiohalorhabdus methylotrophus TaxID=3242694 RepID=A0ABV4TZA6_9GAMM
MKPGPSDLQLYRQHQARLIEYAAHVVGSRAHAEDIVQEAYIRFSARRQDTGEEAPDPEAVEPTVSSPVSYLYRIVRNLALDWKRRSAGAPEYAETSEPGEVAGPSATPEQAVLQQDQLRILAEALAELPERTRIAFDMHRLEGRTLQEVADSLGISVVRAHQLVKDAIRHASARMDGYV